MAQLESMDYWPELLKLKDEHSLKELADRYGVTAGAIVTALKRTGTARSPSAHSEERAPASTKSAKASATRPGSKDRHLEAHRHLLGTIPDSEVANKAGVSVRTVAAFRARHGISGFSGKRRVPEVRRGRRSHIDEYAHLLGSVADQEIARMAGVSPSAVRNYRHKRGLAGVGTREKGTAVAVRSTSASSGEAWRVTVQNGSSETHRVILGTTIADVATKAKALPGRVVALQWLGEVLA